jgi:hypothetical protein
MLKAEPEIKQEDTKVHLKSNKESIPSLKES